MAARRWLEPALFFPCPVSSGLPVVYARSPPRALESRKRDRGATARPAMRKSLTGIALSASSAECHPSDCYLRSGATDRCVEVGGRSRSAGVRFARSTPPCAERAQPPRRGEPRPPGNGRRGSQRGTPPDSSEPSERGSVSCMYSSRISLSTTANPSSRETTLSI